VVSSEVVFIHWTCLGLFLHLISSVEFQGSVATQTVLGGLAIYPPVAIFLLCICAKNYETSLAVDQVNPVIIGHTFLGQPVFTLCSVLICLHYI